MRVRGKHILIGAAVINAALVAFTIIPQFTWRANPSDPRLSRATRLASQILGFYGDLLCIPLVFLIAAIAVSTWRESRDQRLPANPCRDCGYDRSGLAPAAKCPECGATSAHDAI